MPVVRSNMSLMKWAFLFDSLNSKQHQPRFLSIAREILSKLSLSLSTDFGRTSSLSGLRISLQTYLHHCDLRQFPVRALVQFAAYQASV